MLNIVVGIVLGFNLVMLECLLLFAIYKSRKVRYMNKK